AIVVALVEAHVVEDIELDFRAPITDVGDAGGLQMGFCLLRHEPWIARVGLAGHWVAYVADETDGGHVGKWIEKCRFRVGNQQHVGLLDSLEPADTRSVEANPVLENLFAELVGRNREMLPQSGHVAEFEIENFDFVLFYKFHNIAGSFDCHCYVLPERCAQCRVTSGFCLLIRMGRISCSAANILPDNWNLAG